MDMLDAAMTLSSLQKTLLTGQWQTINQGCINILNQLFVFV